jgi:hypothetical protein
MLTIDRSGEALDDADARPAGALVPTGSASSHARAGSRISRPDPTFVAHLIATAEQVPQTRRLCRAAPQEALSAYAAHLQPAQRSDRQIRQVVI